MQVRFCFLGLDRRTFHANFRWTTCRRCMHSATWTNTQVHTCAAAFRSFSDLIFSSDTCARRCTKGVCAAALVAPQKLPHNLDCTILLKTDTKPCKPPNACALQTRCGGSCRTAAAASSCAATRNTWRVMCIARSSPWRRARKSATRRPPRPGCSSWRTPGATSGTCGDPLGTVLLAASQGTVRHGGRRGLGAARGRWALPAGSVVMNMNEQRCNVTAWRVTTVFEVQQLPVRQ